MPTKQIAYKKSVAANKHLVLDAIGGNTTIPSNATTVELQVTVIPSGTGSGSVLVSPAANEALGVDVAWDGGQTTQTIRVGIGLRDQVTVKNTSAATVKVSVSLKGYSTQVTADGINGSGGDVGTALLNDGNGHAYWGDPGSGGGAGSTRTYADVNVGVQVGSTERVIAHVNVPSGDYVLTATGTAQGQSTDETYECDLKQDGLQAVLANTVEGIAPDEEDRALAISARVSTTAESTRLNVVCKRDNLSGSQIFFKGVSLVATKAELTPAHP